MTPKKIHYFWFGKGPKSDTILKCIESWKQHCPDFELHEWTEDNYDVHAHPFSKAVYAAKKWAFVADFARIDVLEREGGVYLDTDMLLVAPLTPCVAYDCFLGEESSGIISAGALGGVAHHPFFVACKAYYDKASPNTLETIPKILTSVFHSLPNTSDIHVYPPQTFYPFSMHNISSYRGQQLPAETLGVHLWDYSWGHPLNKLFKKLGIHRIGTRIVEILGIKTFLKKLFGFV